MLKATWVAVTAVVLGACQTSAVERSGDPCESVPVVTQTAIEGMDKEGAASFVENNRSLMNLEIVWLEDVARASCTHMYVSKILQVENNDNGKIEIGYFRGASRIWNFHPDKNYGTGWISNGNLSVRWSYGTFEVERAEGGELQAVWRGEPFSLVPGRKKGMVKVLDPLDYE